MEKTVRTSHSYNYTSASLSFILWGSWAYYLNRNTYSAAEYSGIIQGMASFTFTLFMVHAVTFLYHQFNHPIPKLLMPAVITTAFTSTSSIIFHLLAGTPQITFIILPASSLAFVFCIYTSFILSKTQKNTTAQARHFFIQS